MKTASLQIALAVDSFGASGHLGGPSNSHLDTLLALGAAGPRLTVVSREQPVLPRWGASYLREPPAWLTVPRGKALAPVLDRQTPARILQWLRDSRADARFRRRLADLNPAALFVEGNGSHRMMEQFADWQSVKGRAINVRGSPEQAIGKYTDGRSVLPRWLAEMAQYPYMVCVSSRVAAMWRAFPELKDKHFIYIPNCAREELAAGVARESRASVRQRLGLPADRFLLVCPGSLQLRKGQDLLLKYWTEIVARVPDALLLLVGQVAWESGGWAIMREIEERGLADQVRVLGFRTDVMEHIYAGDLCVVPSREEAMPLTVLEAMALGTPVVASDVCGIPELIESSKEGLLFDIRNPALVVDQVACAAGSARLRAQWAVAAQAKYQAQFARVHQIRRYAQAAVAIAEDREVMPEEIRCDP